MSDVDKYYIGLDCGTNSVGWAVTDEKYHLLRKRGKTLWGMRLFNEANTAAGRRLTRSTRRRTMRARNRLKLLRMIFSDEIAKVDPDFYIRLQESFFLEEDKKFDDESKKSKNTLFNDPDYKDKDFYKKYPTIWHLRKAIIEADDNTHFDIREYFLAIQHILKNRGHFLVDGKMHGAGNFDEIWKNFSAIANEAGYDVKDDVENIENLLKQKITKSDKKKLLAKEMIDEAGESLGGVADLAGLLIGSKVSLKKIFELEKDEDYKVSFAEGNFEEKIAEIEEYVEGVDKASELINAAKRVYDFIYLSDLLRGNESISVAMVGNYDQHKKDLQAIKNALKPYEEDYKEFFKTKEKDEVDIFYNAYINKAYTHKTGRVNQEDINKKLEALFEKNGIGGELLEKAKNRELLPKQRGQAKGTIPQQLHHDDLEKILKKLVKDFPSFGEEVSGENEKYNTKAKKIEYIHSFRIPYYCGPIKQKDSVACWATEEIKQIVYPWNFKELVDLGARADGFIGRMTNECTYVIGADVLPKSSLAYQKYMVLNELNNLKINGKRIDNETKQKIFEYGYLNGELNGKGLTLRELTKRMHSAALLDDNDELGGTNDVKVLPKLSTHEDFKKILGDDYSKKYSQAKLEKVIRLITILNNERGMLAQKIEEELGCDKEQAKRLSKLNYKDWGKFSSEFLNNIRKDIDGVSMSILDALWNTSANLMELLGAEYGFGVELEKYNEVSKPKAGGNITYEMVKKLYCSPAVKRTVWQAIKIVKEIEQVMGEAPAKVFLEVTRGEEKGEKKIKLARRKELQEKYKAIHSPEAKELLAELENREDRDLQSKKLFLYFSQMGRCAYSGERIELDDLFTRAYDIDHIFPRSRTKDDSITRNLVLVKAELNREKTNTYPISEDIRAKMHGTWQIWQRTNNLITKEKYERLVRACPLSDEELAGFISRQLVETSQSVKAIRDLIQQNMTQTKVVMVKAENVSDFRRYYASGEKFRDSDEYKEGMGPRPEFIKLRELNDLHHAKDAYLNIVVGNVLNSTFTDNPISFIRRKKNSNYNYSIKTERIFRNSERYYLEKNVVATEPKVEAWDFGESVKTVSDTLKRNDVSWTRMNFEQSGELYNSQIVGKSENMDGILPIKEDVRLQKTDKYGGYNSVKGSFFCLIEMNDGNRKIVQIPILAKKKIDEYIAKKYDNAKVIISKINFGSLIKINGCPLHLTGRDSDKKLSFYSAKQLTINEYKYADTLKKIARVNQKLVSDNKYELDEEKDELNHEKINELFNYLLERYSAFEKMPEIGKKINEIRGSSENFMELTLKEKVKTISELLKVVSCNAAKGNLSAFVNGASEVGKIRVSNDITKQNDVRLILQSPTGLFEKEIDLKTTKACKI